MIVLFSGGLDSFTNALMLRERKDVKEKKLIFFNERVDYSDVQERRVIELHDRFFGNMELLVVESVFNFYLIVKEDGEIPFRNAYYILYAMEHTLDKTVIIGNVDGDNIYDNNEEFRRRLTEVLKLKYENPVIDSFTKNMTKGDEVKYIEKIEPDALNYIYSCFRGEEKMCGNCPACFRLFTAYSVNNLEYLLEFENDIRKSEVFDSYFKKWKEGKYSGRRAEEMEYVFRKYGRL